MNITKITSKKNLSIGAALILAAVTFGSYSSIAQAADIEVKLTGTEQVPPVNSAGSGSGEISVADDGSVSGTVTATGIMGTAAHIHVGASGTNGPPAVTLTKNGDTYTVPADAKLTAAQLESFKQGNLYVNVHTAANPDGELRGQLKP